MTSFLSRLTLSQRIQFALGAVLLFSAVSTGYLLFALQSLAEMTREQVRITSAAKATYELDIAALQVVLLLEQYSDSPDDAKLRDLAASRAESAASRARLRQLTRLPDVLDSLDHYEALLPARISAADRLIAGIRRAAAAAELAEFKRQRDVLDVQARAHLQRILLLESAAIDRVITEGTAARQRVWRNMLIMGVLNFLAVVALLYSVIASGITRRLNQLSSMARQIASGDYSQHDFIEGRDEIGLLAREFNEMAGKLAEFDKVKEEFVALASHQLRTPSSAVKGNLGMLLEGYCGDLTPEQREIVNDAQQSNERQLNIIDDMLWVARTEAGRLELHKAPTALGTLVDEAAAALRYTVAERSQTLHVEKLTVNPILQIDAQKIRMVFENLLSNASKYTPEGGKIEVTVRPGRNPEAEWAVEVRDNGVGIEPDDIGRLFNKFSRIQNPLSDKVGGSGLGLFLAREIVRLHGGSIHVTSAAGQGSTFTVVLPK